MKYTKSLVVIALTLVSCVVFANLSDAAAIETQSADTWQPMVTAWWPSVVSSALPVPPNTTIISAVSDSSSKYITSLTVGFFYISKHSKNNGLLMCLEVYFNDGTSQFIAGWNQAIGLYDASTRGNCGKTQSRQFPDLIDSISITEGVLEGDIDGNGPKVYTTGTAIQSLSFNTGGNTLTWSGSLSNTYKQDNDAGDMLQFKSSTFSNEVFNFGSGSRLYGIEFAAGTMVDQTTNKMNEGYAIQQMRFYYA
eukprot:Nk52_evm11s328 gene=Nk52_evmTU11s328